MDENVYEWFELQKKLKELRQGKVEGLNTLWSGKVI